MHRSETDLVESTDVVLIYLCRTAHHFLPEQQLYLFIFIASVLKYFGS